MRWLEGMRQRVFLVVCLRSVANLALCLAVCFGCLAFVVSSSSRSIEINKPINKLDN